jgi:hypothetical protein
MSGRQGGKKKPLKQAKKEKAELDDDDLALKEKLAAEKKKLKELQERAKGSKGFVKAK